MLSERALALCERQHGVVSRRQLLQLGSSPAAVKHALAVRRLHPLWRGVYAVGRPRVSRRGRWLAAVLACGPTAVLSHISAAELWSMHPAAASTIEVSVRLQVVRSRPGIVAHRRSLPTSAIEERNAIPTTSPAQTLIDLAGVLGARELEAAVNRADQLGLIDPESLRSRVESWAGRPGCAPLRRLLDRDTFRLTDSELERRFLRLAERAGLPRPLSGRVVNGHRVDFHWPALNLVVETDGLRYHRTPAQQARDRKRDHSHTAAGTTQLRFTHAEVRHDPNHVIATLTSVIDRLSTPAESFNRRFR